MTISQIKKEFICLCCMIGICISLYPAFYTQGVTADFSDVSTDHWAYEYIKTLREIGVTEGIGDNVFGMGASIKRSEFVKMLTVLMGWQTDKAYSGQSFTDCGPHRWYYPYIETAAQNGAIIPGGLFLPEEFITRADMAAMLVRALGYDEMAGMEVIRNSKNPFIDISAQIYPKTVGHIILASDFGIIGGTTPTTFVPEGLATREQAAAMMIRLYEKYQADVKELHGFYAFSSYSQKDVIPLLDSVSGGWSRLEYWKQHNGAYLNMSSNNGNAWAFPQSPDAVLEIFRQNKTPVNLTVFMDATQTVELDDKSVQKDADLILFDSEQRKEAIEQIILELTKIYPQVGSSLYSGVTIDFEGLINEKYKEPYIIFLTELKERLNQYQLTLSVAVLPKGIPGWDNYKGYDFRRIGEVADRVILMAHDYEPLSLPDYERAKGNPITPVAPIDQVYYSLKAICDKEEGVADPDKVMLAISFDTARWTIQNGKVSNQSILRSDGPSIYKRLCDGATEKFYSTVYESPYIKYFDPADNTTNVVWYEDERSIEAKIMLARMFGINRISVWRLGIMPDFADPPQTEIYFNIWGELYRQADKIGKIN